MTTPEDRDPRSPKQDPENGDRKVEPMSEWMKVMLEEIERKREEQEEAAEELSRREDTPGDEGDRAPERDLPDDDTGAD